MYSSSKTYFYSSNVDTNGQRQVVQNGYGMEQKGNDTTYFILDEDNSEYVPVDENTYTSHIKNMKCPKSLFYQRPPPVPKMVAPPQVTTEGELDQLRRENRYLKRYIHNNM